MTREEAINKLYGLIYGVVDRQRIDDTCREVIDYLKEQKQRTKYPVRKQSKHGYFFYCPKCGTILNDMARPKYCSECGQKVKWE